MRSWRFGGLLKSLSLGDADSRDGITRYLDRNPGLSQVAPVGKLCGEVGPQSVQLAEVLGVPEVSLAPHPGMTNAV